MKKLLLITLLFAAPQAFALFKTTGKTAQQIEQEQKEAMDQERIIWSATTLNTFADKLTKNFPALRIQAKGPAGKLLEIVSGLQDILKNSFQNLESPLLTLKQKNTTSSELLTLKNISEIKDIIEKKVLTVGDLQGLINALNSYANNRMGLPRLASPLDDIYNKVKDTYKKLVESDNQIISISQGKYSAGVYGKTSTTGEQKLADAFLEALIFSIVQGEVSDELLPLITHSLELKSTILKLQPAKGTPTAGEEGETMSIPKGEIEEFELNY